MSQQIRTLDDLLRPVVMQLGYELWGLVYQGQGKHSILRVYIDSAQGITLDDCQKVSHQVSAVLDVENPISSHYSLEISSPGLDRPLFTQEQYQRFIGHQIQFRLHAPQKGRRNFKGRLQAMQDERLVIQVDNVELTVMLTDIEKANLVPEL